MINNSTLQKWDRLARKQLSQQFVNEIIQGMGCSPFEAQAVLETVERVYGSYFDINGSLKPGQLLFSVVSSKASPQLPLARCPMVTVVLTLDAPDDLKVRQDSGAVGLRRHRLQRLCGEAYDQGGLMTLEDLAERLLNSSTRTLCRDVRALRAHGISLPLRSTIKDMGRSVSHRSLIVSKWLAGASYTQISQSTSHSEKAIANYVEKFKRVYALDREHLDNASIGFLVRMSPELVGQYRQLIATAAIIGARAEELAQFVKKTAIHPQPTPPKATQQSKKGTTKRPGRQTARVA